MLEVLERSPLHCSPYLGRLILIRNATEQTQTVYTPCALVLAPNAQRLFVLNNVDDIGFEYDNRKYYFQSVSNYYELLVDRVREFFIPNLSQQ